MNYFETIIDLAEDLETKSRSEFNEWLLNYSPVHKPEDSMYIRDRSFIIRGCGMQTWLCGDEIDHVWLFQYDSDSRGNSAICKIIIDGLQKQSTEFISQVTLSDYIPLLKFLNISQMQTAQRILNRAQKIALTK
jgi:sulfur transfer protein SufE